MRLSELVFSAWNWRPGALCACAGLLLGCAAVTRFRVSRQTLYAFAGVGVLLLASASPLAVLARAHLFSAHVLQHVLLLQMVPPLLLLSVPRTYAIRALAWTPARTVERFLGRPVIGWLLGAMNVVGWHLPAVYGVVLHHEQLHMAQPLCLVLTGVAFWWPIAAPLEERRLQPLLAVCYLFAACSLSSLIGILIAFAPPGVYAPSVPLHGVTLLPLQTLGAWPASGTQDQQLGGLLMWVPCCLVYVFASLATLLHWYGKPEEESCAPVAALTGDH